MCTAGSQPKAGAVLEPSAPCVMSSLARAHEFVARHLSWRMAVNELLAVLACLLLLQLLLEEAGRPTDRRLMAFVPFVLQLFACLVVTAAISPAQPAPRMAAYISRTIGLFAVCSMFVLLHKWMFVYPALPFTERYLRAVPHFFSIAMFAWLGAYGIHNFWPSIRWGCATFWGQRYVANVLLQSYCSPATYPPGEVAFETASGVCVFNLLAYAAMTPRVRQWISNVTGGAAVTVGLTDLAADNILLTDLAADRGARAAVAVPSVPSTCDESDGRFLPAPDQHQPVADPDSGPLHVMMTSLFADDRVPVGGEQDWDLAMQGDAAGYWGFVQAMQQETQRHLVRVGGSSRGGRRGPGSRGGSSESSM